MKNYAKISIEYVDKIWKCGRNLGLEGCLEEMEHFLEKECFNNPRLKNPDKVIAATAFYERMLRYFPEYEKAKDYIKKNG